MSNFNFLAFGTFGNPNGFTQTIFVGNPISGIKTFDIRGSILIYPKSTVYSIRKEIIDGMDNMLSYAKYTYGKEPTSARDGSFIGCALLFSAKKKLEENILISILNDFHQNLIKKNVVDDTIIVNHSDKFSVEKPRNLDKIELNLNDSKQNINFIQTNKSLVIFCETSPEKLQFYFRKSIDLLNVYDTIYFTKSEEVATFVAQKGIFKFIQQVGDRKEFDLEIEKLEADRKQKIINAISRLRRAKEKLEEESKREIENLKNINEKNDREHFENGKKLQDGKQNLSKIENLYLNFFGNITGLVSGLHSGKNLDEVNISYKQLEKEFNEEKRKLGSSSQISSFSNPRSSAQVSLYPNSSEKPHNGNHEYNEDVGKSNASKVLTIISLVLNVLLIGGITYLYFINDQNENKIANSANIATSNEVIDSHESDSVLVESKLNPFPNDVAKNQENKAEMLKKFDSTSTIKNVVDITFERNKSIREVYQFQKNDYKKLLFERNKNAFEVKNGDTILVKKDLLQEIPSYNKLK